MTSRTARTYAIATSVLSTAAVPVVLATTGTWNPALPAPDVVRQWIAQPMNTGFVTALTIAAAVTLWLLLSTTALTHAYTALARRARWTVTLRLPSPIHSLTAALLGASAVTTAAGSVSHAAPVATSNDELPAAEPATPLAAHQVQPDPEPTSQAAETYTVRRGDSLCRIAARTLGDADRWPEIYALNRGTHFPRVGGTLRDPNLIYPGWILNLPTDDDARPPRPDPPTDTTPPNDDGSGDQAAPTRAAPANPQPDNGQPAGTPAHHSTAPGAPTAQTADPAAGDTRRSRERASCGVRLPSGSWVDLGLASAITAAIALVWAHRRRRYMPRTPSTRPRLDDPTLAPMPRVARQIRHGLRRAADAHPDPIESTPPTSKQRSDAASAVSGDEPDIVSAELPEPVTPAPPSPLMEVWAPAGLGLTGPGAEAAARGFLVSALAAGGLAEPNRRGYVVIPSGTLATLLGADAVTVPDTPRLTVTGGLSDALTLLEEQTLHRTRVCFDYEVDTITGLRDVHPMVEPLPPMLLIADTTAAHERARIAALLTQGQRLDIHGILLGVWPDGDTTVVAEDGTTSPAEDNTSRHGRHPADIGRLAVIDPTEAADLLRILAESHTGQPQSPAPAEPAPLPNTLNEVNIETAASSATPHNGDNAAAILEPAEPDHQPTTTPPSDRHAKKPTAPEPCVQTERAAPGENATTREHGDDTGTGRIEVQVLGDARVIDIDTTQHLRAKALELLVYLAARGGTASQEAILEDLLPEAATSKAPHRLHTYVYNLRRVLKSTGGAATHLSHPDRRYMLHRETIAVDLWRMSDALDEANRATTLAARVAALRRAVDAYQGPLAGSNSYEWIEPYREAVQRQAVDAALALADALADQPGDALAVLTTAISHSPYTEALYQAAMRVHAALGDTTAIRDLQRQLARSLDEIDTEVSDETTALARTLTNRLQHHRRGKGKAQP